MSITVFSMCTDSLPAKYSSAGKKAQKKEIDLKYLNVSFHLLYQKEIQLGDWTWIC